MGTISGLVSLPYSYMERRMPMLPTLISRIDILGAGERRIPLYGTGHGRVDLASDEDFFTVSFSVPEMTHPDNIQIECFLEGLTRDGATSLTRAAPPIRMCLPENTC